MKKVYFFGIIILLLACNYKPSNFEKATVLSPNINNSSLTPAKLKACFNGVWVAKNYVDDLTRTQSPYSSFRHLNNVASFSINLKDDTRDSLVCGYSLNNHEGAEFTL